MNNQWNIQNIDELLSKVDYNNQEIAIYGAGLMGRNLYRCLASKPWNLNISCFIVENTENNPDNIDEIPVISLKEVKVETDSIDNTIVFIALHEKYIVNVMNQLSNSKFKAVIPISFDSDIWTDIRAIWMKNNGILADFMKDNDIQFIDSITDLDYISHSNYLDKKNQIVEERNDTLLDNCDCLKNILHLYVVHSDVDKVLKKKPIRDDYEIDIQVGVELTKNQLFDVADNTGMNISIKNREYCELTALYWIWKNDSADYVGLSHYRRKFNISDKLQRMIKTSQVDIIVTIPVVNLNTIKVQYAIDHDINDWDIMMEAINMLYPEYTAAANKVGDSILYFAYNMLIAKKNIFNKYCEWLFAILEYCEHKIGKKEDQYQNRYAGFLSERLLNIFIMHNTQYKIIIENKTFYESY